MTKRKKKLIEIDNRTEKRLKYFAHMGQTKVKPYIERIVSEHVFKDIVLEYEYEEDSDSYLVEYHSGSFDLEDRKRIPAYKLENWYNLSEYGYWDAIHRPTNQLIDGIIPFDEFTDIADEASMTELLLDYLIHNDQL